MFGSAKRPSYRRNNGINNQDTFGSNKQIFQKSPITILEELFPHCAFYSWAVLRNYGCGDIFKCHVKIANYSGESVSFSKKIAKHQAALEALINVQRYSRNKDLEKFIRNYVCGGSSILCLKSLFPCQGNNIGFQSEINTRRRGRSRTRRRNRSKSRGRSRSKTRDRSRSISLDRCRSRARSMSRCRLEDINEAQRRSRSCSRPRGNSPFHFGGMNVRAIAPLPLTNHAESDAVHFLQEECKIAGIPAPEYATHFRGRNNYVVYIQLGPFTSEGFGVTREQAQQAAATAMIETFIGDK